MAETKHAPCGQCGMVCDPREYHSYAACLMFMGCHDGEKVRGNLAALAGLSPVSAPQPNAAQADGWISVDDRLPEPGKAVLLDIGLKTPIRAMWASKHSVEAGDECPDAWAEDDEGSDTYYCPEGWYEWNQYEETHWAVSRAAVAWMALPAPPTLNASKGEQP